VSHRERTAQVLDQAALYALGALDPEEATAFEAHLAQGCRTCEAEVRSFTAVAAQLGHAAAPASPRAEVRARLFAGLRTEAEQADWIVVPSTAGSWEASGRGQIGMRRLFGDPAGGRFTALVRMERGARYPGHRHADMEELYLLEGALSVDDQPLRPGDYCAAPAGTIRGVALTEGGCLFLLHAAEREQVLDEAERGRPRAGLVVVRGDEGSWKPGPEVGVTLKTLFADRARGTATCLVRMRAGARLRPHRHVTAEQFYMLEGDAHVTARVLRAGDYYRAAAGTTHEVTHTDGGCLFLMISSRTETLE
jgi:anti-sigma factor ChrR (cupin superfamily)